MNWLLNRLKEKSTWLAIFTVAGLFGMRIEPELREQIINAILAVAALVAFIFRENIRERSTDRKVDLPPIKLVGKPESRQDELIPQFNPVETETQKSVESYYKTENKNESGWNG